MSSARSILGKSKSLTWKVILILVIALTDLHLANANSCYRIANCSCQNTSRLLCSGSSTLSIAQLRKIVPSAYVLYIDIRGRLISQRFLIDLNIYFPRLKTLRIDKRLCSIVLPLIGKLNFTVIHHCYIDSTTDFHGLTTPSPGDTTAHEIPTQHFMTTPFPGEVTTRDVPTPTFSPSEDPITSIILPTTPLDIHSSTSPSPPNVTRFFPPDVPSPTSHDIVISVGHSTGFYVSIVIPASAALSIIVGILACCARWFTDRFVPCFGYRHSHDDNGGHNVEAEQSTGNNDQSNRPEGASGPDDVNASATNPCRVVVTKKDDGDLMITQMGRVMVKKSDQTEVKVPLGATSVDIDNHDVNGHDKSGLSRSNVRGGEKSLSTAGESTLVPIPTSESLSASRDIVADCGLPLPSHLIQPFTSTPMEGKKTKPSFSFMGCFGKDPDGYRALSPASVGTPASAYQTPAAYLSPSAESMVSTVALIKDIKEEEKQYPIRSRQQEFELLPGVEGRKRAKKSNARRGLQQTVELSASSEAINLAKVNKQK